VSGRRRWGHEAVGRLLQRSPDVDAIFCSSDIIARGIPDALRERGHAVPADVAVVGFDNWEIVVAGARPQPTTVVPNRHDLGQAAAGRQERARSQTSIGPGARFAQAA
jgi:LacI family transcriptional regulator